MVVGKRRYCGSRNFVFLGSSMLIGIRYRLEHSAQLLKMRENFLPLHNVYLCRYLQRDLYPHCVSELEVVLRMIGLQPTSHRSLHSWKKGSIDDVNFAFKLIVDELFPPIYVWHVQDPKGPWEGDDEVKVDDLNKAIFNSKLQYLILSVCVIQLYLYVCVLKAEVGLNAHKSILLKMVMRFRIATNNSRRSFHSWKKGSMDDVPIPIESYHMHDPSGTHIKHEPEFQQMTPIEECTEEVPWEGDDEVKVDDLNKAIFNSKLFLFSLKATFFSFSLPVTLTFLGPNSISSLCSHQLPTAYFRKLQRLTVSDCGKLMSPSVARGALNLRILKIDDCQSMEEVITKEEEQGEGIFLTNDALELPFLREVLIDDFPEMKTFVQQGISVSTPSLKWVNYDDKVKVDNLNKWTQQRFTSQEQKASQGTTDGEVFDSRKLQEDEVMAALKSVCRLVLKYLTKLPSRVRFLEYKPMMRLDIVLLDSEESRVRFLKYKPVMRLDIVLPESEESCLVA
ncbi:hypothetical protein KY285_024664 [Solanum tuberosum]|nr:hypothetical protein KY285_024664 [Solanum tuberosum]